MFPTYNPNVSLHQQRYFPQRISNFQTENVSREDYGSSVASPSRLDNALGGPKTAPASIINFPADVLALKETHVSSVRELEKLWKATNGYEPDSTLGSFDLKMSRYNSLFIRKARRSLTASRNDDATFNFGSTPTQPFYTLETYDTHELCISRTHPRKPTKNIPILLLSIEAAGRRLPPNDGLVTFIFPKLAAMLAIDQSTQLAAQHHLAPTLRDEMQADAVQRAAAQEACHLKWNENERRYELAHPAIGRDPNEEINPDPSPPTPDESEKPVLHITVSSHALASPMSVSAAPPVILVTNPNRSSSSQPSAPAELRMSTVPLHDAEEPLASLDFGSMILHVSAAQILELMPSLYAIDSIVSAIFAVAVADEATNPIMARMDLWIPRPKAPGSIFGGSVAGKSYAGSVLYATIAEREEAEEEAKLMRQLHEKDTKGKSAKKSLWAKSKKKKKQTKQIVIGEFDLEKYGHYQGGSREGQELPGVVRGALEAMFVGLRFIVWMLTTAVQVIAWVMVGLTRCLTSEKF